MADPEALVSALTLAEKAALTSGADFLSTVAVERLGIPTINVTDGPNGTRGKSFPGLGGPPATCIPCGSAVGASWDPSMAERLGEILAQEALDRGCRGLLAPTVNLHRSPLAGRNFECYSEDPLLAGRLAAGYVRGVQSLGVFATVKHFVGNDAEFERGTISSVIDERTLRELYLVPFEIAVREGGAAAIMSSYNRLNGRWLTEQPAMLMDILRGEWGFDGFVMTDWYAVASTTESLIAGLDLEMPGPGRALGSTLVAAVNEGRVDAADLDGAVGRFLHGLDRLGALDAPPPTNQPRPPSDGVVDLIRRAACESIVLLTNDGTLPLARAGLSRVAVIGPRALSPCVMGGGSAAVIPHRTYSMPEVIAESLGADVEVIVARGCEADLGPTVVGTQVLVAPQGFQAEVFDSVDFSGDALLTRRLDDLRLFVFSMMAEVWPETDWSMRVRGSIVPVDSGRFELALAQAGQTRVWVDGELVLDGITSPPPGGGRDFFGMLSQDLVTEVELTAGVATDVVVEFARAGTMMSGFRVGFRSLGMDALIDRAVATATAADVAIVMVGTSEEWETETRDRPTMDLPGRQAELVRRVAAANPRTVVVVNAASPVEMPWANDAAAIVQCWFGGQEMPVAIADVLIGRSEPGGRLPTTIPMRLEHNPSYDNFPGENGELRYGEGLFMGYRGYDHRCIEPRFPFGHGLSYTSFEIGVPELSAIAFRPGDLLRVQVPVTNTGDRRGSHVVQCYVAPDSARLARPPKELKAFQKVWLEPGESIVVELALDDRSFAYWDPADAERSAGWRIDPGQYDVLIGASAASISSRSQIDVLTD